MQVVKWGNGLALRLPAPVVEALQLIKKAMTSRFISPVSGFSKLRKSPVRKSCWSGCANIADVCLPTSSLTAWKSMKTDRPFFDANVQLYLLSEDNRKADRAESIIASATS
ncbi:AbrB/MazE/SpoVT family DNA-binding domain-containing protein [Methylobacter sp.]|uniref:AbrB/MazE/SpoVT family DNA-binding domain-containing protein n=1 Tax=Methylobacter sp. TaxID=2051955 RepID=UPI002FDD39AE